MGRVTGWRPKRKEHKKKPQLNLSAAAFIFLSLNDYTNNRINE